MELNFADTARLSHAYILSAQERETALRAASQLAAAAVCSGTGKPPCGVCRNCRKAAAGIHPDIIGVERLTDDKGKQKKEIIVEQIRDIIQDSCVLPNEAGRKVYIIREADMMNTAAQNAALKLFEEPPQGVVFVLCAVNPAQLLPTVRSRCAEINLSGGSGTADEAARSRAQAYFTALASRDRIRLAVWCTANEQLDNRSAADFIAAALDLAADMLCSRTDRLGLNREELLYVTRLLTTCGTYLRVNTGVRHIFGMLAVSVPELPGNRGQEIG